MTVPEELETKTAAPTEGWRMRLVLEATQKYGTITKAEAVARIGATAANSLITRLIDESLLKVIKRRPDAPSHDLIGLTGKAKKLLKDGVEPEHLLEPVNLLRR